MEEKVVTVCTGSLTKKGNHITVDDANSVAIHSNNSLFYRNSGNFQHLLTFIVFSNNKGKGHEIVIVMKLLQKQNCRGNKMSTSSHVFLTVKN